METLRPITAARGPRQTATMVIGPLPGRSSTVMCRERLRQTLTPASTLIMSSQDQEIKVLRRTASLSLTLHHTRRWCPHSPSKFGTGTRTISDPEDNPIFSQLLTPEAPNPG